MRVLLTICMLVPPVVAYVFVWSFAIRLMIVGDPIGFFIAFAMTTALPMIVDILNGD